MPIYTDLAQVTLDQLRTIFDAIYAQLASPALTGTPTVPTAAPGTNTTQTASCAFVRVEVAALVDSSPAALDTLNELAAALGDDPNFATTITNALAGKLARAGDTMSGNLNMDGHAITNVTAPPTVISGNQTVTSSFNGTYYATDSSDVVWGLPEDGEPGTLFSIWQGGAGKISFPGLGNATVHFAADPAHTKTARVGAAVTVICLYNSDGNHAVWGVAGATA